MMNTTFTSTLASSITKAASKQTYYTVRFLADRERVADAYRAYAYFRWVDDTLDAGSISGPERGAFLGRQKSLLEKCYRGESTRPLHPEEQMLVDLIQTDPQKGIGLHSYLHNMMAVMTFDANRRGSLVLQSELNEYTRLLASAVMEAMHYFIGHGSYSPRNESRYLAVTAAHITHMLRDTFDDVQAGYFNIPREVLEAHHISPFDIQSEAYRTWVRSRVRLARAYFQQGREYLSQVENMRCRLASLAYTARFEWLLDTIEKEGYCLRPQYGERKSIGVGLQMAGLTFASLVNLRQGSAAHQVVHVRKHY